MQRTAAPPVEAPAPRIGFAPASPDAGDDRLSRSARYLINEGFSQSLAGIAYYLSQRIAELYPEKALVECTDHSFDPVRFWSDGECSVRMRDVPYAHLVTRWTETSDSTGKVERRLQQGWLEVEWEGERLEVLMMHWPTERSFVRHCFILADAPETALRFLKAVCTWNARPRDELLVFDGHSWEKDEDLFSSIKGSTLENLVLPGTMLAEIVADVEGFFEARETYRRYGVPWKRGIIFAGPPGNGKTHMVKSLVNRLRKPCLYVKSFDGYHASQEAIATVFQKARRVSPCVLIFEDLDTLVTKRNRSFFLNEMDGFAGNDGVLALATSNHPEKLDPAIARRPSRFDRTYVFGLPELELRQSYLMRWSSALEPELRCGDEDIAAAAELTEGFSYAYLKELGLSAVMAWMRRQQPGTMGAILREQAETLRGQMAAKKK